MARTDACAPCGARVGGTKDCDAAAGGVRASASSGVAAGRAARGAAGQRRRTDEIREKVHGECPAEPFEVVRALMRVLNATEQNSLSRLCRKLREGDVLKFVAEITHEDEK